MHVLIIIDGLWVISELWEDHLTLIHGKIGNHRAHSNSIF